MAAAPQTSAPILAREYETVFILRPDVDNDGLEKSNQRVADVITKNGGHLVKVEVWGKRKLSYKVRGEERGVYCVFRYLGPSALVAELERNFRMWDHVIKFLTIRLGDKVEVHTRLESVTEEEVNLRRELVEHSDEEEAPEEPRHERRPRGDDRSGPPADREDSPAAAAAPAAAEKSAEAKPEASTDAAPTSADASESASEEKKES